MSRGPQGYQELRVAKMKIETAKAYCFIFEGVEEGIWIPKSQCDYDSDSEVIHVSAWIVDQKPELQAILKAQDAGD